MSRSYCLLAGYFLFVLACAAAVQAERPRLPIRQPVSLASHAQTEPAEVIGGIPPHYVDHPIALEFHDGDDGCSQSACDCLQSQPACLWGRLEYLLWWRKGMDLPVLVSTGRLGDPTTQALFGGSRVGDEVRPGGRVTLGHWLDNCAGWAVGGRFFALGEQNVRFDSRSTGEPTVARPFFDLVRAQENALVVNSPAGPNQNLIDGHAVAGISSDVLGADVYLQKLLYEDCRTRLDLVAGYQASRIDEELHARHSFRAGGVSVEGVDQFTTRNEFHGGQLGFLFEYHRSCFSLDVLAKVGLGNTQQVVTIDGSTVVTNLAGPPQVVATEGGLLAQPTNSGSFTRDEFTVVPELGINLAYHISPCIDVSLGYSLIYWSEVVRPADQIDRVINDTQIGGGNLVGEPRPRFLFQGTDFWVQGVNAGVTWHF